MNQLPTDIGLPTIERVIADNPHGSDWTFKESGDQGPTARSFDRFVAVYVSREGYQADYFHFDGYWSLGAN